MDSIFYGFKQLAVDQTSDLVPFWFKNYSLIEEIRIYHVYPMGTVLWYVFC